MDTKHTTVLLIGVMVVCLCALEPVQGGAQQCLTGEKNCTGKENCTYEDQVFCCPDEGGPYTITYERGNGPKYELCKCVRGEAVGKRCNNANSAHFLSASFLTCAIAVFLGTFFKKINAAPDLPKKN